MIVSKSVRCFICESILDKNAIGLNKKLLDEKPTKYLCINCMANHLDVTVELLLEMIKDFKEQGCKMFD